MTKIPLGRRLYVWDKEQQELKEVRGDFFSGVDLAVTGAAKMVVQRYTDIVEEFLVNYCGVPAKFKRCPVCGGTGRVQDCYAGRVYPGGRCYRCDGKGSIWAGMDIHALPNLPENTVYMINRRPDGAVEGVMWQDGQVIGPVVVKEP